MTLALKHLWGKGRASPFALVVVEFIEHRSHWDGSASELLIEMKGFKGIAPVEKPFGWPEDGKALSATLTRIAPLLRKVGIEVSKGKRTGTKRSIVLKKSQPGSGPTAVDSPAA